MLKLFAENEGKKGYLDLLSDPEMEQFFTKGIRGGQSFISQRYAEGEKNPENAGKHLLYVDGKILFRKIVSTIMTITNICYFQPITCMAAWKH